MESKQIAKKQWRESVSRDITQVREFVRSLQWKTAKTDGELERRVDDLDKAAKRVDELWKQRTEGK